MHTFLSYTLPQSEILLTSFFVDHEPANHWSSKNCFMKGKTFTVMDEKSVQQLHDIAQ